jgi:tetratricopeptide (TPR) repeat protein
MVDHPGRSLCRELATLARAPEAGPIFFAVSEGSGSQPEAHGGVKALRSDLEAGTQARFRWRITVHEDWPYFLAPVDARDALEELFAAYPFPLPASAESLARIQAHYQAASVGLGLALEPPDLVLTLAANGMMEREAYAAALETFQYLVELYPSSLNGPWGLANLHRVLGDSATAIRYYEECLRRDPKMAPAREWIRRLGGGN